MLSTPTTEHFLQKSSYVFEFTQWFLTGVCVGSLKVFLTLKKSVWNRSSVTWFGQQSAASGKRRGKTKRFYRLKESGMWVYKETNRFTLQWRGTKKQNTVGGREIHFCVVIIVDEPLSWRAEHKIVISYHFAMRTDYLKVLTVWRSLKGRLQIITLIN